MNQQDYNTEKNLNDCQAKELTNSVNIDPVPKECTDDDWPSQRRVFINPPEDWRARATKYKLGLGQSGNCDPVMTGQIINDLDTPDRTTVYRYTKAFEGCNEAMVDLFRNVKVIDENGQQHIVPIIWASQEKAVAAILQDNIRKDNSLVVDRIVLPTMAIWSSARQQDLTRYTYSAASSFLPWLDTTGEGFGFTQTEDATRDTVFAVTKGLPINISYTLYIWTLYEQDMLQIMEQVYLRFNHPAYIRVKGVWWEIIVTYDSEANNSELEPGDNRSRVLKSQVTMTAKTYLPQPIRRIPKADIPVSLVDKFNNPN